MLSPRTMSLRAKNRALLKALDKYTDIITQSSSSAAGFKSEHDRCNGSEPLHYDHHACSASEVLSSFHKHLSEEDLSPRKPLQWQNAYIPRHKSESHLTFDRNKRDNCISSAINAQEKCFTFSDNENYFKEPSAVKPSALGSTDDLRAVVHEILSDMKESKPLQTMSHILKRKSSGSKNSSTTTVKSVRGKPISLQQQRAAEAQMHAPTHAHLLSKCSCTDFGRIKTHPDSKYIVQLYSNKQHIPSRLKRQRYRADSISRPLRTVKWADNEPILLSSNSKTDGFTYLPQPNEDLKACGDFCGDHHCNQRKSPRQVHSVSRESQSSFLDRVKTFRESHWADCHASPRGGTTSNHECVQHYILNRRLFLEPVHTVNGESSCPVCTLRSNQPEHGHDIGSNSLPNRPSKILVTLPTVLLEGHDSAIKSSVGTSLIRNKMQEKK